MTMQLERLQSQALVGSKTPPHRALRSQSACCLPPLRIATPKRTNLSSNGLKPSPQLICSSVNANSLFLLRPRDGPSRDKSKPLCITQASARKSGWEYDGELNDNDKNVSGGNKNASGGVLVTVVNLLKKAIKLAGVILILSTAFAAAAPAILSTSRGLKTITDLASYTIPGTVSIAHANLGWRKPVNLEGITLKSVDGETVASVSKVETQASLWSMVRGKTGFGDATITAPVVDLQQDAASGQPRLALALTPLSKLLKGASKNKKQAVTKIEPAKEVALTATFKAPRGGLEVVKGKVILPQDAAATVGSSIFLDVAAGRFALEGSEALASASSEYHGKVPIHGSLYSDCAQVEALGFLDMPRGQVQLIRPIKADLDLTPEVGKLYMARVNPLLGEIVGPAIGEEDLPDVTLYVAPGGFRLPSDEYSIRIEPMKTTLVKGQLMDGVLSLLSRQDLLKGRTQITALTSPIQANINLKTGVVTCDRLDLLLADSVHIASWGIVNILEETVQMTLAIPGSTLRKTLGLSKLAHDYYLKIPILGSLARPQVDFRAAGKGIAQLTLQQQTGAAGQLFSSFFQQTDKESSASEVPKSIGVLPWDTRS